LKLLEDARPSFCDILSHVRRWVHSKYPAVPWANLPLSVAGRCAASGSCSVSCVIVPDVVVNDSGRTNAESFERYSRERIGLQQPAKMVNFLPACREEGFAGVACFFSFCAWVCVRPGAGGGPSLVREVVHNIFFSAYLHALATHGIGRSSYLRLFHVIFFV
jgi:hypothetical protein